MDRLPEEITENGIHYTLHGDYYFPDIIVPQDNLRPIGKWGRMHMRYLQEYKPLLYNQLVLQGKLSSYLADLNKRVQEQLEVLIRQMKRVEGVDERMKARDRMLWVGRMNNIRQQAEEIVISELVSV